jgi:membrane-associated phospholipid phosphatase
MDEEEKVLPRGDDPPGPPRVPPPTSPSPFTGQRLQRYSAGAGRSRAGRWRSPWLISAGLLLILILLTIDVLASGPLVAADHHIRAAVQARATSPRWLWLSQGRLAPAQLLVDLGNNQVAIPVLAVCALIAVIGRRTLRPMLAAAAGVVLLLATVVPAKILIGRSGPGFGPVPAGSLGVFPSGHTSTSSVCYGLAVLLLVPVLPARFRAPAVAAVAAVCLLVGLALVWCDYHWFTDVLAGWALSGIIIQVCLRLAPPPAPGPARSRNDHGTRPG